MLAIQEGGVRSADEKLAAVRVGPGICHREGPRPTVANVKVLVSELITVDGLAAGAILVREVASLCDRTDWDETHEDEAGIKAAVRVGMRRMKTRRESMLGNAAGSKCWAAHDT